MTIAPLTAEWHAARRAGIGASEIAAVLGISPWESPLSLYWRKVNGWQVETSPQMEWGTRLEDAIAAKFADNHPDYYVHPTGLMVHPLRPWQMATPDRLLCDFQMHDNPFPDDPSFDWPHPDGNTMAVLDLKTAHSADGWGEPGTAQIPVHYRAQLLWQMNVAGVNVGHVAVLIGGSDYREYVVPLDTNDINVMLEAGRRFMDRIERGDPPPVDDHHATVATLKLLHPELVDETATVDDRIAEGYLRAARMRRLAEKVEKRYEALIRDQIGSARVALTATGRKVATHVITEVAAEREPRGPHRKDYLLAALPKGSKR